MAWMSDEAYEYMQDSRDKKITARSARHTRTHCGKGGAVKFPSDYMTEKERKAMSGECKSYRMNSPMTWNEFKDMPDDLKILYIKAIREKYNVPDKNIANMFGISAPVMSRYFKCLGLAQGKAVSGSKRTWDKEGFLAWCGGAKGGTVNKSEVEIEGDAVEVVDKDTEVVESINSSDEVEQTNKCECCGETKYIVPETGEMNFKGNVNDILRTINKILDGSNVRLSVQWNVVEE